MHLDPYHQWRETSLNWRKKAWQLFLALKSFTAIYLPESLHCVATDHKPLQNLLNESKAIPTMASSEMGSDIISV